MHNTDSIEAYCLPDQQDFIWLKNKKSTNVYMYV